MAKIKYFIDGKHVELEVDDEFAKAYAEIDAESKRNDWKHRWRRRKRECSIEVLRDSGFDVPDERCESDDESERPHLDYSQVIKRLEPPQQWLVEQLYILKRSQKDIADELGVTDTAIRNRLKKIREKLEKLLK